MVRIFSVAMIASGLAEFNGRSGVETNTPPERFNQNVLVASLETLTDKRFVTDPRFSALFVRVDK